MTEPIRNTFSCIPLVHTLLKDFNLACLGTICKNKPVLPIELSNPQSWPLGSSMFAYDKDVTLVSYIPNRKKNVIFVWSLHNDCKIDIVTGKPEMIVDYNNTLDKMCAAYECAQNSSRWPMVIFYSILNMAGVNSLVFFYLQNFDKIARRLFLLNYQQR